MNALVAYVPVIHAGYLKLFNEFGPLDIHVLSEEFLNEMPILERDMRSLPPDVIVSFAKTIPGVNYAGLLTSENLHHLARYAGIILPDEEVSRVFAERHLSFMQERLKFESVFLRWSKMAATAHRPIDAANARSLTAKEQKLMQSAFEAAKLSSDWWRQIGAVAFRNGKVLTAFNRHHPSEQSPYVVGDPRSNFNAGEHIDLSTALHAEAGLVAQAASSRFSLSGADVFVTTFPCPPCATLLANCGIKRLFFVEGYSLVAAQEILEAKGVEIIRVLL